MSPRLRTLIVACAVAASVLLVACGGDDEGDSSSAVLPFSEIQATEFVFETDPSDPNRGIFRVETTEPMICAIV